LKSIKTFYNLFLCKICYIKLFENVFKIVKKKLAKNNIKKRVKKFYNIKTSNNYTIFVVEYTVC